LFAADRRSRERRLNFRLKQLDQARTVVLFTAAALALSTTIFASVNLFKLSGTSVVIQSLADIDAPMPRIVTSTVPATLADYQKIAERIHVLYPDITVNPGSAAMVLTSLNAQSYQSWRLALSETRSSDPGTQWNLKQFCAGNCQGAYFSAEVSVSRSAIEVKH
jgi:hypothetical protein